MILSHTTTSSSPTHYIPIAPALTRSPQLPKPTPPIDDVSGSDSDDDDKYLDKRYCDNYTTPKYNCIERPLTSYSKTRPPIHQYTDLPTDLPNSKADYNIYPKISPSQHRNYRDLPPRPGAPTPDQDEYRKLIQKLESNGCFHKEDLDVLIELISNEDPEIVKIYEDYEKHKQERKLFRELKQVAMVHRSRVEKYTDDDLNINKSPQQHSPNYSSTDMLKVMQDLRNEHYLTAHELKVLENVLAYKPQAILYAFEAYSTDYDKEELANTLHLIVMKFIEIGRSDPNNAFENILQTGVSKGLLDEHCIPWLIKEYQAGNQVIWGAWQLYLENHDIDDFVDTLERVYIQQYVREGLTQQQKNALKLLIDLRFSGIINIQHATILRQAIYANHEKIMGVFQSYALNPLNKKDYYENVLLAANYYQKNQQILNPANINEKLKQKILELFRRKKIINTKGLNILNEAIENNDPNIQACV